MQLFRPKQLLSTCRNPKSVSQIHALLILNGISCSCNATSQLISSYARVGDIAAARLLFDKTPQQNVSTWNAMLAAYSCQGCPAKVVDLYHQLLVSEDHRVRPDSSTFTLTLKACAELCDLGTGEGVFFEASECGYKDDIFVGSSVLNLHIKCGKMEESMKMFNGMKRKDIVSWTTMITGFAKCGLAVEAIGLYRRMQAEGVEGDGIVLVGLFQACAELGDLRMGMSVHGFMIRRDIVRGVVVETSLVDMYIKNGYLKLSIQVFNRMCYHNMISWASLITGCAQNGFAAEALQLLIEMQNCGFTPDSVTLVSSLLACSHIGYLKLGKSVHGFITRKLEFDQILSTAVIDMYAKCGSLSNACTLFHRTSSRDAISWNTMIAAYGTHGCGKEALSLFLQMEDTKVKPDDATFASLLSAFSHSGLVEEGQYWFDVMVNEFKIKPGEKHYACIIDLLARSGHVGEAIELVKSMHFEPEMPVWVALLSGCCKYGNLEIGEMVARKVLEMKPDDPGIYTLVSNIFAAGKRWDEVAKVRKLMKQTGIKKVPGYSTVAVRGNLHAFFMEDKNHPQYDKIILILRKLDFEMRKMGYVPKTEFVLQDLEEEVKERLI